MANTAKVKAKKGYAGLKDTGADKLSKTMKAKKTTKGKALLGKSTVKGVSRRKTIA